MKIKSIISLLCVALGTFVFQACDDVPAPYDIPQQGSASIYGSGTLDEPYSVQGASLNQSGGYAWVKGHIVGYIPLASSDNESYTISDVVFATDGAATSNIVIADDADETDINSCMAVQLPSGDVRSALNLSDHPENIGQAVFLYGTMERYYGASGVKNVTAAIFNGEEIGDMPDGETVTGENLIANGGFETWENGEAVGWTPSNTACNTTVSQSTDARSGNYSAMVEGSTEQNRRLGSSEMSLKAGTYSITAYVKAVDADASIRLGYAINEADGSISGGDSYVYGSYVNNITSSEWTEATYQFTLTETTRLNLIVMVGSNPGQSILIDDYSLTTTDGGISEGDDSTLTFVKTTEVRSGARYIIAAMVDGVCKVAQNLSESYSYGYLYVTDATADNDEISIGETYTYTITESNGGYTIQDSYGRYLYMTGTYNSFNVSETLPNSGYLWTISFDADGLATITNVDMGKWVQYSSNYTSFGSYSTTQSGGVLPYLYVEN